MEISWASSVHEIFLKKKEWKIYDRVVFLLSAVVIGLDQWLKIWIVANYQLGETHSLIDNVLSLTYLQNTGAAWSILEGKITFAIITVIAVAVVVYLLFRYQKAVYGFVSDWRLF